MNLPSGVMSKFSGSCPPCRRRTLSVARSTSAIPSLDRSGGGSLDSSTPGPPIGEPLTATTSVLPSGVRRTPRGRCPASIVFTTLSVAPLITVTLLPRSSDTYTSDDGPLAAADAGAAAVDSVPAAGVFSPPEHAASATAPATTLPPNNRPCHVPRIASLLVLKYRALHAPARARNRLREPHSPPC